MGSRVVVFVLSGAMATLGLLPVAAHAQIEQGHPELFENGSQVGEQSVAAQLAFFGQLHLESTRLGSEGIECVTLGFGSGWNAGAVPHALLQILGWDAAGHVPEGRNTKLSASCRPETAGKPASFITDEAFIGLEEDGSREVEPDARTLSVPWNVEVDCGVREEEFAGIVKIGVPNTEFPQSLSSTRCPENLESAQPEEEEEYKREREEKKGCYVSNPAPEGCVRLTIVEPAAGEEVAFGGTLRAHLLNGVKSGLSPTYWQFEGATSGALQCEFPSGCGATGVWTGRIAETGFRNLALIRVR